jgi:class 3 adenylate cyclase
MTDDQGRDDALEPVERPLPVRISDAERNKAVEFLRHHCGDGRLTLDEFSDRVGLVFEATTSADLEAVTRDLPALALPAVEPLEPTTATLRRRISRFTFACMGGGQRRGRWRLEGHHLVVAFMGGTQLDLRGAEIIGPEVSITIIAFMGGAQVIVPEGVAVELSGMSFMGGKSAKINEDVPRIPGTPLVRVHAYPIIGGVGVRSRPSKAARRARELDRARYREEREEQRQARHAQRRGEREKWRAEKDAVREAADQLKHRVAREIREQVERAASPPASPAPPRPPGAPRSVPAGGRLAAGTHPFASPERLREWLVGITSTWDQIRTQMPPEGTVTIVFSDIEGFTPLTERVGDRVVQQILRDHNAIIRGQLAAHGGFEVKSQGDGFMMAFSGATRALRCAVGIQRELRAYNKSREEPVLIRMGLHTGDAIREANDFLGHTVNLSARIADHASGGQILVSGLLHDLCAGSDEFVFDEGTDVDLRGLAGGQRVHGVKWE